MIICLCKLKKNTNISLLTKHKKKSSYLFI